MFGLSNALRAYRKRIGPATPNGYATLYPTVGPSLFTAAIAACRLAVLVPAPANIPSDSSSFTPKSGTSATAMSPETITPSAAAALALMPSTLVSPLKNWSPY